MSPRFVAAIEVYTLIDESCRKKSGVIVQADSENIKMLGVDGRFVEFDRRAIDYIVVYNTLENPMTRFRLTSKENGGLKKIYAHEKKEPLFHGWPIKFIDDLIIFLDTQGKSHVLSLKQVQKVRDVSIEGQRNLKVPGKRPRFSEKDLSTSCDFSDRRGGLAPTRIFGDKIQINEFLSSFETGYEEFESFQERTYLYARPMLFEQGTRLGVTLINNVENPYNQVGGYFQWSTGKPYHFQSFTQIGTVPVEHLSTVEPLTVARTEVKSHLFHASFVGHLNALAAGTEYYTQPVNDSLEGEEERNKTRSATALNYMALLGVDYESWSFSFGQVYPTFLIKVEEDYREILGSSLSPVFRLRYVTDRYRLRGIFSQTGYDKNNVSDLDISFSPDTSSTTLFDSFKYDFYYIRGGFDFDFEDEMTASLDQLIAQGEYSESLNAGDNNRFDFSHMATSLKLKKQFGEYVALSLYLNHLRFKRDYSFFSVSKNEEENETILGGMFEFIF